MTSLYSNGGSSEYKRRPRARETFEEPPLFEAVFTYIGYGFLAVIGYVCDFLRLIGVKEGHRLKNVSLISRSLP